MMFSYRSAIRHESVITPERLDYVLAEAKTAVVVNALATIGCFVVLMLIADASTGPAATLIRIIGGFSGIPAIMAGFFWYSHGSSRTDARNDFGEAAPDGATPSLFWERHKDLFPATMWGLG
jgi:hypothetical protein